MVFLVWYLIASGKFDYKALAVFLDKKNLIFIPVIFLLLVASHLLFTKRYQIFLNASVHKIPFKTVLTIIMIGVFYNNFLPGGVGGDLMRIYYLKRKEKVSISSGSAITLFDRLVGMLGLVFVAFFSLWLITQHSDAGGELIKNNQLLLTLTIACPVAVVAMLFLLRVPRVYKLIEMILSKLFFGEKMISFMNAFQTVVKNTKVVVISFILCIFGHIFTLICISIIAYTLYGEQAVYATMAVAGVVILTSVVPITPGNIGWTEWLADNFYRAFGMEGGATVFALWRVVMVLFSLIGGIFYLYSGGGKTIKEGMEEEQAECVEENGG